VDEHGRSYLHGDQAEVDPSSALVGKVVDPDPREFVPGGIEPMRYGRGEFCWGKLAGNDFATRLLVSAPAMTGDCGHQPEAPSPFVVEPCVSAVGKLLSDVVDFESDAPTADL
jgi:hypothetical protein